MHDDLSAFLKCLNDHEVAYLVIGGHAMAVYGRPRYTGDLDLWIARDAENARVLVQALAEFGFPVPPETEGRVAHGRHLIRLGRPPQRVDLLNYLGGADREFEFEAVRARAQAARLLGVDVWVLSKEDLIAAKRAAGRPRDLRDIASLEEPD